MEILVPQQWFVALLSSHGLQGLPLELTRFVIQEDSDEDEDRAGGAEDSDLVAEHDDAQPNRQRMLHGAGDTEEGREMLLLVFKCQAQLLQFHTE